MPDDGACPGEQGEGRTASCSVGPKRRYGSLGEAREVVARELAECGRYALPGDWKGLEKDLRRPSAMLQPVIARVRGPKEVQIRDRRAESRDGARGRIDRGSGGGALGLLCESAHELVAGKLDAPGRLEARGCEDELIEGPGRWWRA